jgi:hypothetical protein
MIRGAQHGEVLWPECTMTWSLVLPLWCSQVTGWATCNSQKLQNGKVPKQQVVYTLYNTLCNHIKSTRCIHTGTRTHTYIQYMIVMCIYLYIPKYTYTCIYVLEIVWRRYMTWSYIIVSHSIYIYIHVQRNVDIQHSQMVHPTLARLLVNLKNDLEASRRAEGPGGLKLGRWTPRFFDRKESVWWKKVARFAQWEFQDPIEWRY